MVHAFSYSYHSDEYYFLWDVESGSLLNVDFIAFLCAKKRYEELDANLQIKYNELNPDDIKDINAEFDEMEKDGTLNSKPQVYEFKKDLSEIKALCLHICHDCNLNCVYCFAGGGTYNTERDYMSIDVGRKAVDFLLKNSGKRKNLEIDFFNCLHIH